MTRTERRVIVTHREDRIAAVILNRPEKLNALTSDMIFALRDCLRTAQGDAETRVVMLRGEGPAFCAGDDVAELAGAVSLPQQQTVVVDALQDISRLIMHGAKPVIVVVHGWAVGAAFSWLFNCDVSVCAESSKAFFPEVKWGVSPTGGATALAPRLLGAVMAREAFLLSRRFTARELFDIGAVTRVVADGEELATAVAIARQLAELPPFALCEVKRLMNKTIGGDLDAVLAEEASIAVATATRVEVGQRLAGLSVGRKAAR